MREDDFQRQVINAAQLQGWIVAHFRPAKTEQGWRTPVSADGKGFPDLVLVRERVMFVELKSERGRLGAEQRAWLDALSAAGAEVYVARPDDCEPLFEALAHPKGWRQRMPGQPA